MYMYDGNKKQEPVSIHVYPISPTNILLQAIQQNSWLVTFENIWTLSQLNYGSNNKITTWKGKKHGDKEAVKWQFTSIFCIFPTKISIFGLHLSIWAGQKFCRLIKS